MPTDTLFTSSMLALACAAILFICLIIWIKYGKTKKTNNKVNEYATASTNPEATEEEVTDSEETEAACTNNDKDDIVEVVDDFMNEPVDEETPTDTSEELAETSEENVDAEEEE